MVNEKYKYNRKNSSYKAAIPVDLTMFSKLNGGGILLNLVKAVGFINLRGSALEKERMRCILTNAKGNPNLFPVGRLQNPDGGFALNFRPGQPSCINNTVVARLVLKDLNLLTGDLEKQVANFILSRQNSDGIFVDPYETVAADIPLWMEVGTFRFAVYYTFFSCLELLKIDRDNAAALEKPLALLPLLQKPNGAMPGYIHNTWFAAGISGLLKNSEKGLERMLAYLDRVPFEEWEGSQLVWALETLVDAGLGKENFVINKWLNWLQDIQNPNGSISSEDGDPKNADVTIHALRVLNKLGLTVNVL